MHVIHGHFVTLCEARPGHMAPPSLSCYASGGSDRFGVRVCAETRMCGFAVMVVVSSALVHCTYC